MAWLKDNDIPIHNIGIERLKKLNNEDLHKLGKFQWTYKDIISKEEIGMWFTENINDKVISEWFYETDTENEIQEKLKNIKIQEKLNKRG